jgi:hypothetical protein
MQKIYEGATGTAKRIRPVLAKMWPGVKFSVKSKSYSGGCSVTVSWTDGPRTRPVDAVIGKYATADFDGMQDLKTYHPMLAMDANGEMVSISGADYVFSARSLSDAYKAKLEAKMSELFGKSPGWSPDYWRDLNIAERMLEGETFDQASRYEAVQA